MYKVTAVIALLGAIALVIAVWRGQKVMVNMQTGNNYSLNVALLAIVAGKSREEAQAIYEESHDLFGTAAMTDEMNIAFIRWFADRIGTTVG